MTGHPEHDGSATVPLREHLDGRIDAVESDLAEVKTDVHEIRRAVTGVVTWRGLAAAVATGATILTLVWMVAGAR